MEMSKSCIEVSMSSGSSVMDDMSGLPPNSLPSWMEAVAPRLTFGEMLSHELGQPRYEEMGLSLELARLTGTETYQQDIRLQNDPSVSNVWESFRARDLAAFEFDRLQFLRLPADFPGSLSLWLMKNHCFLANRSESFYRSISTEQWLRTVITTQKPSIIFCYDMRSSTKEDGPAYFLNGDAGLEIHSNTVPRRAFLTRLEGVIATCRGHQCTGAFFPITVLHEANPPCQSCTKCALAEQLRIETDHMRSVVELDQILKFWFLETTDVKPVKDIKGGDVSTILWRNGTFARKRFPNSDDPQQHTQFNRELDVALTVSHPNIVHCFGCSRWWNSADCDLFMEVLEEDLESFLSRLEDIEPRFSFRDSLEVMLQIADAVKHLHEKRFFHGDLKPGNILLSKLTMHSDVPFYLVKVADFGCTQRINSYGATVESFDFKIGSPSYTAPEVYRCRKIEREIRRCDAEDRQKIQDLHKELQNALQKIDPKKIDVYSFGVLAHNVVTGVPNVEGTSLDGIRLGSLELFIQRCRAQEPQDRPPIAEICSMLSSVVEDDQGLREKNAKRKHHSNDLRQHLVKKFA